MVMLAKLSSVWLLTLPHIIPQARHPEASACRPALRSAGLSDYAMLPRPVGLLAASSSLS